jgi:hypothetical protein
MVATDSEAADVMMGSWRRGEERIVYTDGGV